MLDPKRFYTLKKPCADCPFRTDKNYLSKDRARDIADALCGNTDTGDTQSFQCHKTLDYTNEDPQHTGKTSFCAGAMILLQKTGAANTQMQIGERLGLFDPQELRLDSAVHESFEQFIDSQRG